MADIYLPILTVEAVVIDSCMINCKYWQNKLLEEKEMFVDENSFFRESTLRICSSLDIEQALWRSFIYIRDFIPADRMTLNFYDEPTASIIIYASATMEGGARLDIKVPLTPEHQRAVHDPGQFPDLLMLNRPGRGSVAELVLNAQGHTSASLLSMRMRVEGIIQGNVTVIVNGRNRYSQEHLQLLSLLNDPFAVALSNSRRYQELADFKDRLVDDNRYLHEELQQMAGNEIVGADKGLADVLTLVRQVAPQTSPVLILGETGAGKEVIARAIHNHSPRRDGPFIKVNCGAIPQSLMDSELFGHEKGAFTGASSLKRGRFERAHQGTILLDEVGELTPEAQIRLLRVLQEKEIERVGGERPINLDIRVIAATHRNLEDMVRAELFREDLYYRLRVFPIIVPPLRKRKEDIEPLARYFLNRKAREIGRRHLPEILTGSFSRLQEYDWPGNVRELEHAVERALILNQGGPLMFDEFKIAGAGARLNTFHGDENKNRTINEVVAGHIRNVLESTGGRVEGKNGAAEILGLNPSTLRYRMRKLGVPYGRRAG